MVASVEALADTGRVRAGGWRTAGLQRLDVRVRGGLLQAVPQPLAASVQLLSRPAARVTMSRCSANLIADSSLSYSV